LFAVRRMKTWNFVFFLFDLTAIVLFLLIFLCSEYENFYF
jgi:hypothetical protein